MMRDLCFSFPHKMILDRGYVLWAVKPDERHILTVSVRTEALAHLVATGTPQ